MKAEFEIGKFFVSEFAGTDTKHAKSTEIKLLKPTPSPSRITNFTVVEKQGSWRPILSELVHRNARIAHPGPCQRLLKTPADPGA
jgi:hypothetical protein